METNQQSNPAAAAPPDRRHEDRRKSNPDEARDPRRRDETKTPDAFGRGEEEGQDDETPKDLPKPEKGKLIIAAIVFLVLIVGLFLLGYIPHRRAQNKLAAQSKAIQDAKPLVDVARPKRTTAAAELRLPGDAIPLQQTSIYPRANGYLTKLYVDIGDHVKSGQLLAEIDTPEIDAQLAAARASVQQSQANVTKAQTDFALSDATLQRYQGLFKTGGVTQQQLDEKQNAYDQMKATLEAAKAGVSSAQAEAQRLAALQGFEKVFAPFDGVVTARNFDVGTLLNPATTGANTQLLQVDRTDTLRVFVNVPQVYATAIKSGQPAAFFVRNYNQTPFAGKVTRNAGAIDPRTRTLRMEIDFPNEGNLLLAGMYGQIQMQVPRTSPGLTIPTSSLVFNAEGVRVATIDDTNRIKFLNVELGRDYGTEVEVTSGLSGTEQIVANPGERLIDGLEVDVSPTKDNGAGGQKEDNNQNRSPAKDTRQAAR